MKCKGVRLAECLAPINTPYLPVFDIGKIVWDWNSLESLVLIGNILLYNEKNKTKQTTC